MPDFIITQGNKGDAPDIVILDFGQNGWGLNKEHIEQFVRVGHFFLPSTQFVILWNRDMGDQLENFRRNSRLQIPMISGQNVTKHYGLPLLDFSAIEESILNRSRKVDDIWPGGRTRHPSWAGHAYYADMFAYWFNKELQAMEARGAGRLEQLADPKLAPMIRSHSHLGADKDWIQPLDPNSNISRIEACLFPLTLHLAREAKEPDSPMGSPQGDWKLYEDRRNKPGWITEVKGGEWLSFNVTFSSAPKLAVTFLRSYENIGTAEISVHSDFEWLVKQRSGDYQPRKVWPIEAVWNIRASVTASVGWVGVRRSKHPSTKGTVSFRLVKGKKFKVLTVISC